MPKKKDLNYITLADMVKAYRSKELSPVEVVTASLTRIAEVNPKINAIYHLESEKELLKQAKASEKRWAKGEPIGELDGVPTTIKDALSTIDMPGFRGSAAEKETVATYDHPTVARMREAGAIILGKNTMCDYGILGAGVSSQHGPTRNPWNLERTTGASSSGAGASVAAGIEPVSIGTDIVGSIRLPASYCGLAGLKPSQGRVPYYPPNSPSLVAGPLARNFMDVALHMNVLAKPDPRDYSALAYDGVDYVQALKRVSAKGKKILMILDLGHGERPAKEVKAAIEQAAKDLEERGAIVEAYDGKPFKLKADAPAERFYKARCLAEFGKQPEKRQKLSPVIYEWTRDALDLTAQDMYQAFNDIQALREQTSRLIDGYDYIILPSTPTTAFDAELPASNPEKLFAPWSNTFLFNLTEQPAASVPYGLDKAGLPIGLQIVGNRFDDIGVLQMARLCERMAPKIGLPKGLDD